jgi:hypothetical protein
MSLNILIPVDRPRRGAGNGPSLLSIDGSPMAAPGGPTSHRNPLLDVLPASDYERVTSHLELVPMKLVRVLPDLRMLVSTS